MTQTDERSDAVLSVSTRDTQWLIATMAMCNSMLNARSTDEVRFANFDSLVELCVVHYSTSEGDALMQRLIALLPDTTPLWLVDKKDAFASTTSYVQ